MFALLPAALFLMLLFLMAQLHSFGRVALVVATVPLGLIGIVLALLLANRPLGFVAILGILALVGMIARNAVILIEQIETERAQGRDIWDAVVEATLSRFRPIMLTAVSTVLGLIPIAPTVFWGPMAFAIMGGLFVATLLTLLVLPVFYITLYRAKRPRDGRRLAPFPSPSGRRRPEGPDEGSRLERGRASREPRSGKREWIRTLRVDRRRAFGELAPAEKAIANPLLKLSRKHRGGERRGEISHETSIGSRPRDPRRDDMRACGA